MLGIGAKKRTRGGIQKHQYKRLRDFYPGEPKSLNFSNQVQVPSRSHMNQGNNPFLNKSSISVSNPFFQPPLAKRMRTNNDIGMIDGQMIQINYPS